MHLCDLHHKSMFKLGMNDLAWYKTKCLLEEDAIFFYNYCSGCDIPGWNIAVFNKKTNDLKWKNEQVKEWINEQIHGLAISSSSSSSIYNLIHASDAPQ